MAEFLECDTLDDEQLSTLTNYLNIKNFRNNSAVNMDILKKIGLMNEGEETFIRKGTENKIQYILCFPFQAVLFKTVTYFHKFFINSKFYTELFLGYGNNSEFVSFPLHLSTANFTNSFYTGKSGSWKEEFSPELNIRADKWIQENLKHTDLRFPQYNTV